jgi:hypothetical protein
VLLVLPVGEHGEQRSGLRARRLHPLGADRLLGKQGELAALSATAGATAGFVFLVSAPPTRPHSPLTTHGMEFFQGVLRIELEGLEAIVGSARYELHANRLYITRVISSSTFRRASVQKAKIFAPRKSRKGETPQQQKPPRAHFGSN